MRALQSLGFEVVREREHIAMLRRNPDGTSTPLTLPSHATVKASTLRTICTQPGISREDFSRLTSGLERASPRAAQEYVRIPFVPPQPSEGHRGRTIHVTVQMSPRMGLATFGRGRVALTEAGASNVRQNLRSPNAIAATARLRRTPDKRR